MGGPKALVRDLDGTSWLLRSVEVLEQGGCIPVLVVLGCRHEDAAALLEGRVGRGHPVRTVVAEDWDEGMAASLRAGLRAAGETSAAAALVHLVDLPDVGPEVVRRVLHRGLTGSAALARADYGGAAGHPVMLGRVHWPHILADAAGDHGARGYLSQHVVQRIECGDLAGGRDVDRRETLS